MDKSISEIISEMKEYYFTHYNINGSKNIKSFDNHLKQNMCKYGIIEAMFLTFYIYGKGDFFLLSDLKKVIHKMKYEVAFIKAISSLEYKEFLQTRYWKIIRELAIEKACKRCELCYSQTKLNVHHKTYDHHYEEHKYYKTDLIVLCQECHSKFHNKLKD